MSDDPYYYICACQHAYVQCPLWSCPFRSLLAIAISSSSYQARTTDNYDAVDYMRDGAS